MQNSPVMLMLIVGVVLAVVLVAVGAFGGKMMTTMAPGGVATGTASATSGPMAALQSSTGLGAGTIGGIAISTLLVGAIIAYLVYLEYRFRSRRDNVPGLTRRALFASDRAAVSAAPGAAYRGVRDYDYRGARARVGARVKRGAAQAKHKVKMMTDKDYAALDRALASKKKATETSLLRKPYIYVPGVAEARRAVKNRTARRAEAKLAAHRGF